MIVKHFLDTVSDSRSVAGIRFISSFFKDRINLKVTLLNVAPSYSAAQPDLLDPWFPSEAKDQVGSSPQVEKTLEESRRLLCKSGISNDNIETKITVKPGSTVQGIIQESHGGHHDAVVFGRLAVSGLKKFIEGSVSDESLNQTIDFPLWICRDPEEGNKNVLLCLDGSGTAIRVADHVGYIIGKSGDHRITLLHVNRGQGINASKMFRVVHRNKNS